MINPGDTLHNPVTGERITFIETSAQTNGERVVIECAVDPHGAVATAHYHPFQTERFEVLEGRIAFTVAGREFETLAGGEAIVEPGEAHRFWNPTDEPARLRCTVTPALQFEQLIETMFALAADGKTSKKGLPNPVRLAVIAKEHFDDVRLPFPPAWMQKAGLALGAPLGRAFGYRATYEPREGTPVLA